MLVRNQKELSGVLFKNMRKTQPNHADYTGKATIEGREFFMDAWINEGKSGKFLGVRFKLKEDRLTATVLDEGIGV